MKRFFFCLLLLFSLFTPLAAQETESTDVNEQYEQFSWEPVEKAKQYGVTIQKLDAVQDTWNDYKEIKTKDTQVEVLFTPGVYRVSICTYNLMGRKSQGSDWVQFKILEEHIPYLNERAFSNNSVWQVPVLYLQKSDNSNSDSSINSAELQNDEYINYITPPELFGSNAILVKGRNIFSPKTEFYLVPKGQGGEKDFVNWCDDRKEQKLNILYRNSKEYQVVVSYDPKTLYPGYYALEVRNPGNNTDAIDILVLDDNAGQITPDKGFAVDEHYNVNSLFVTQNSTYEFSVLGKGVNSATSFYLEPAEGAYPYAFESQLPRSTVELEVTDINRQGDSTAQLTVSCEGSDLRTGYYNLIAKNWDGNISKFLCLVKKPFDNDYTKEVKRLKTKFNKKTEYVDVTIQDEKFDSAKTYTLISAYDESTDSNNKVPLVLYPNGNKLTGRLLPDELTIAKYAILVEDSSTTSVIYCELDNTLKITQNKMTESAVEQTFLRPASTTAEITLDADDTVGIKFVDNKVQMIKKMPYFFSNLRFDLTFLKDMSLVLNLEYDLFNCGFASLSTGYEYRVLGDDGMHGVFSMLRLAIPNNYFAPYIGAGIGQLVVISDEGVKGFGDVLGMFTHKDQVFGIAQVGVMLFTLIDVRYNLYYNGMFSSAPYFTDSLSFGFSFPLRSYKFKRNVLTRYAQVTANGSFNAKEYLDPASNVDHVMVLTGTSVGGFEDFNNLESVYISYSVETIEENAFRNCKNLKTVDFDDRIGDTKPLTIVGSAFANDTKITTLYLPYRTSVVQAGAFAGWTRGQNIILDWDEYDETPRDLIGLNNCGATVHYKNGKVYKGSYENPLEDEANWIGINELEIENVAVHYQNEYILGIRLEGFGWKWYKQELESWINQETPQEALDYLKQGDKISFKVQGDGNAYDFVVTTVDGGYFHYKFKTKKDALITVEIPFKKLKKYKISTQKKLDMSNIKMFCIMPMCKDEWDEVTFFDFEVSR